MFRTHVSCILGAPIGKVWQTIRPFDSITLWHPYVATCTIERGEANDKVGCIRRLELRDGGVVRETLLTLSDLEHCIVYDIIDSPMPVENYVARIDLREVTEGNKTFARWRVEFDTPDEKRDEMIALLQDIFRTGLQKLDQLLAS